eukprot:TRINITY_DN713_c1_g1_i1.p1 TRINITY_DN713_c1_g1~~TRINITY_DN713_c1_g1_i1.p1  ORF type:complete len:224 (+),score=52.03 TRINITY_DN713_c1_g1_i1:91-672(+)
MINVIDEGQQKYVWNITQNFDWTNDRTRIVHGQGQNDEICSSIKGHETTAERCIEIINSESRYVFLPDSNVCCSCCPSHGPKNCGLVHPNWAEQGDYQGTQEINMGGDHNVTCDHWTVQGAYLNHFYTNPDYAPDGTVMPCQFWEIKPGKKLKRITYQLGSWKVGPQDPSLFELPQHLDCSAQCQGACEYWKH